MKNKISNERIKIGSLNDEIGNHNYEIGILKEKHSFQIKPKEHVYET